MARPSAGALSRAFREPLASSHAGLALGGSRCAPHRFLKTSCRCSASATAVPSTTSPAQPRHGEALHLILLGAPGAGKGTQTDSLMRKFSLTSLTVGNLLRDEVAKKSEVGVRAARVMKEGGLLDNATILQVVKPGLRLLDGKDWILDGYPRTAQQAHDLAYALQQTNEAINLVVNLDVPDEVLIDRIENRWVHLPSGRIYNTTYNPPKVAGIDDVTGEKLIKRMDDSVDVFQRRLNQFHRENEPIKQFYKERGTFVNLQGRTSAEIYPKLEKVIRDRFPQLQTR